jgi:ketosteroid isomerase-like protein
MTTTSPEERIELVRRGIQAYNAADTGALLRTLHPEVEIESSGELMNAGTYRGHDGYLSWVSHWHDAWEDFQQTPEEIVPVGERHVVVRMRSSGRGRGSGLDVAMTVGWTYEVRDRLCVYMAIHPTFEAALAQARDREGLTASEDAA